MTTEPTPPVSPNTAITEKAPDPSAASTAITPKAPEPTPPAATPAPVVKAPPTWPLKADFAILAMLLILAFFLGSFTATNSDLWSHLAIGKRYSEGKFGFGVDPFSWAAKDVYWVHHAWLYSWLVYGIHSLFGGAALVLFKAIVFTAAIGLLARVGWNESNRWFLLICVVMTALAASVRLLLQPTVISLLFLAITLFVLERVGVFAFKKDPAAPDRTRWLWYLPGLFAVWANFDSWFILGPLLLALCWAAGGLKRWFPSSGGPVPTKLIGQVLGVGLLACVLNPHHVRVFQLPAELAYLVLAVTDPLNLPLPDAIVGAGRTFKEIATIESGLLWTASSISAHYWQAGLGLNPAGMAVFPLLVLGLAAFTLVALIKQQDNAPTLHLARFLPWLVFAILGLALYRMIPFFVVIAAPLTALTLGEFVNWQQVSNAVSAEKRDRGLNLARIVSVPFLLILLALAWPGWLSAPGGVYEYNAPRRVAWRVRPDPSLQKAALALGELKKQDQCGNVFNTSIELGDYLPWFAPDVKYCFDSRFALYPGQAPNFERARRALLDPGAPEADWQRPFTTHKVDQVAIKSFMPPNALVIMTEETVKYRQSLQRWWLDEGEWRQRYADQRILVFSWAGLDKRWPNDAGRDDLNRLAFGEVPEAARPSPSGTPLPQPLSGWALYFDGLPPPGHVGEIKMQQIRYETVNLFASSAPFRQQRAALMMASLTGLPLMGTGDLTVPAGLYLQLLVGLPVESDFGPPALPILMVRGARKAVADSPYDAESHHALYRANNLLRNSQEDYWMGYRNPAFGPHPAALRDRVRRTQMAGSAFLLTQLRPDVPDYHNQLSVIYASNDMFDLALESRQKAIKAYEERLRNATLGPREKAENLKRYLEEHPVEPLEQNVRQRLARFKEVSDRKKPLERVSDALYHRYQERTKEDKVMVSPLGLGKKALDQLLAIDPKSLAAEEQLAYLEFRFHLLLSTGNVDAAVANLQEENVRKALPPVSYANLRVLTAAALGDYTAMEEALPVIEKAYRDLLNPTHEELKRRSESCATALFLAPVQPSTTTLIASYMQVFALHGSRSFPLPRSHAEMVQYQGQLYNDLFNTMTLRGIVALEAGDTKKARQIFEATLNEAGAERYFSDRPIAQRYLDLLKEQGR